MKGTHGTTGHRNTGATTAPRTGSRLRKASAATGKPRGDRGLVGGPTGGERALGGGVRAIDREETVHALLRLVYPDPNERVHTILRLAERVFREATSAATLAGPVASRGGGGGGGATARVSSPVAPVANLDMSLLPFLSSSAYSEPEASGRQVDYGGDAEEEEGEGEEEEEEGYVEDSDIDDRRGRHFRGRQTQPRAGGHAFESDMYEPTVVSFAGAEYDDEAREEGSGVSATLLRLADAAHDDDDDDDAAEDDQGTGAMGHRTAKAKEGAAPELSMHLNKASKEKDGGRASDGAKDQKLKQTQKGKRKHEQTKEEEAKSSVRPTRSSARQAEKRKGASASFAEVASWRMVDPADVASSGDSQAKRRRSASDAVELPADDGKEETMSKVLALLREMKESTTLEEVPVPRLHKSLQKGRRYELLSEQMKGGFTTWVRTKKSNSTNVWTQKRLWRYLGEYPQIAMSAVSLRRLERSITTRLIRQAIEADPKEKAFWSTPLSAEQCELLGIGPDNGV